MAFVIEDGTGRKESNAYYTPEIIREYAYDRNINDLAELEDKQLEGNIIVASSFLDSYFPWRGEKKHEEQGLEFPRVGIVSRTGREYPNTLIPDCFLSAVAYLSIPKVNTKLTPTPDPYSEQNIKRILYQVGGDITKDITYAGPGELIQKEPVPYLKRVIWDWLYKASGGFLGTVIATGIKRGCWDGYHGVI